MPRAPEPPPLDGLPDRLRTLAQRGEWRRFRKGQLVIQEGSVGDAIYIIVRGRLRAFSRGEREREITYGVYGPGEYLGEMSLDGGPRSASVEAVEACDCVMVTRVTLQRHIAEHPDFAFELLAKVIRRARAATLSTKQLALNDVYGRLRLLLDSLAEPDGDTRRIALRPTHREMAHHLGCSREMVSKLMKDLENGGYVQEAGDGLRLAGPLPQRW